MGNADILIKKYCKKKKRKKKKSHQKRRTMLVRIEDVAFELDLER